MSKIQRRMPGGTSVINPGDVPPPAPIPTPTRPPVPVDPPPVVEQPSVPPPPVRPAPRRTSGSRQAAEPQPAAVPASIVMVPPPPADFLSGRKPLQVKLDPTAHWYLKIGLAMRGRDMSSVVSAWIGAFNADPEAWLQLIDEAAEQRVPLADLIKPALDQLRGE